MNFKEILELIDKVAESGIATIEIERAGTKIKIEARHAPQAQVFHSIVGERVGSQIDVAQPAEEEKKKLAKEEEAEEGLHIITSPIVGTFYRAQNPEAEPFVAVGDRVSNGKTLCIIEAMKLMNEIECDADGVVARVYPQNGQPVEYGEKLFAIKV